MQAKLRRAVADGHLTQAEADAKLAALKREIERAETAKKLSKEEQAREDGPEDGVRLIRMQHTEPQPNARDIVRCMWTVCVRVSGDAPGACQVEGSWEPIAAFAQFLAFLYSSFQIPAVKL